MRQLKNKLILISIIIFIASLFFTAFKVIEPKEIKVFSSAELLLLGPISFVGGSVLEFFIWTANFITFSSIYLKINKKIKAKNFTNINRNGL